MRILISILFLLCNLYSYSQTVELYPGWRVYVNSIVQQSDSTWDVSFALNHPYNAYDGLDVQIGDILYTNSIVYGDDCNEYVVTSIIQQFSGELVVSVIDKLSQGTPSQGIGVLVRLSESGLTHWIANVGDPLNQCISAKLAGSIENKFVNIENQIDSIYAGTFSMYISDSISTAQLITEDTMFIIGDAVQLDGNRFRIITPSAVVDTNTFLLYVDSAGVKTDSIFAGDTIFIPAFTGGTLDTFVSKDSFYVNNGDSIIFVQQGDTIVLPTFTDTNTDTDSIYFNNGDTTILILRNDTIFAGIADTTNYLPQDSFLVSFKAGYLYDADDTTAIRPVVIDNDIYFQLNEEAVEDVVAEMFNNNFHQNITVTYDDNEGETISLIAVDTSGRNQSLTITNDTLFLTDADTTLKVLLPEDLVFDGDSSVTNELQDIDSVVLSGNLLTVYISDGASASVDLSGITLTDRADTSGYNLTFYIENDSLNLTDGIGNLRVDLSPYLDNTDTDSIIIDSLGTFLVKQRGDIITLIPDTDEQNLSLIGDSLLIDRGTGVDLSLYRDTFLDTNTDSIYFNNGDSIILILRKDTIFLPNDLVFDGDSSVTNELQDIDSITLSENILTVYISEGQSASVNLSSFSATDTSGYNSTFELIGNELQLTDGDGLLSVNLSSYLDNTDTDSIYVDSLGNIILKNRNEIIKLPIWTLDGNTGTSKIVEDNIVRIYGQNGISTSYNSSTDIFNIIGSYQQIDSIILSAENILTIYLENGGSKFADLSYFLDNTDGDTIVVDSAGVKTYTVTRNDTIYIPSGDGTGTDTSGYNKSFTKVGDSLILRDGTTRFAVYDPDEVGGFVLPTDSITFNNNEAGPDSAELNWDATLGYLVFGGVGNQLIQIGQDQYWMTINQSGGPILKGEVVRAAGAIGNSGKFLIEKYLADGNTDPNYLLGVAAHDIPNGSEGYVMHQGKIRQIDLTDYQTGQVLYVSPTIAGDWVTAEPANGYQKLPIAFVVDSSANGTLAVRVKTGEALRDLHDVDVSSPTDGSLIAFDSVLGYWVTKADSVIDDDADPTNEIQTISVSQSSDSITIGLSDSDTISIESKNGIYTSSNNSQDAAVTAIGVPTSLNYDANTLVIDGSNNRVGIGTSTPSQVLQVVGDVEIDGKIDLNDGYLSTFVGEGAGEVNTGTQGTGIGYQALNSNTTGINNNAIGFQALLYNTSGGNNNAMGRGALVGNTTGSNNTAVGSSALQSNTSGQNNTAIGFQSMLRTTTGQRNEAIGYQSLYENTIGSRNIGIGFLAGRYTNDLFANQLGNNSIFIGYDARPEANNQTNQMVIGYAGRGEGSNTIKIGNSNHSATYIEGIKGQTTASAANVHITADGRLMESTTSVTVFDTLYSVGDSLIFITPTPDTFIVTFQTQTDDWGTQVVQSDATLDGTGVTGNLLTIAQQSATDGQVLKWDNTAGTWLPANDIDTDTNTDEQDIDGLTFDTLTGNLTVGITNGSSQSIDLDGRYLQVEIDGDPTNELDNTDSQQLGWTQSTGVLTLDSSESRTILQYDGITRGLVPDSIGVIRAEDYFLNMNGTWKVPTDLDNYITGITMLDDNDDDNWTITISRGGGLANIIEDVDLSKYTQDDQTLSFQDSTLSISDGNSVNLKALLDYAPLPTDGQGIDVVNSSVNIGAPNATSNYVTSNRFLNYNAVGNFTFNMLAGEVKIIDNLASGSLLKIANLNESNYLSFTENSIQHTSSLNNFTISASNDLRLGASLSNQITIGNNLIIASNLTKKVNVGVDLAGLEVDLNVSGKTTLYDVNENNSNAKILSINSSSDEVEYIDKSKLNSIDYGLYTVGEGDTVSINFDENRGIARIDCNAGITTGFTIDILSVLSPPSGYASEYKVHITDIDNAMVIYLIGGTFYKNNTAITAIGTGEDNSVLLEFYTTDGTNFYIYE